MVKTMNPFSDEENKILFTYYLLQKNHLSNKDYSDYLQKKLGRNELARIDAHLILCKNCRDEMTIIQKASEFSLDNLDEDRSLYLLNLNKFIPISIPEEKKRLKLGVISSDSLILADAFAESNTEWSNIFWDDDRICSWTYREDSQKNLIIKFRVYKTNPKKIELSYSGNKSIVLLKQDGDELISEKTILRSDRLKIKNNDDLVIRLIY